MNLSCSADGFPTPDIMWYFEDMIFANDTVDITNSTYAESTIVITDLMLSNGGTMPVRLTVWQMHYVLIEQLLLL